VVCNTPLLAGLLEAIFSCCPANLKNLCQTMECWIWEVQHVIWSWYIQCVNINIINRYKDVNMAVVRILPHVGVWREAVNTSLVLQLFLQFHLNVMEAVINDRMKLQACLEPYLIHVSIEFNHQRIWRRKFRTRSTDICTAQSSSYESADKRSASGIRPTECSNVAR
jgi:hypothetical protein